MFYTYLQNQQQYTFPIPIAKNGKIQQIVYKDENIESKKYGFYILGGGKFGANELLYEQHPSECHSKYTFNQVCDNLIGINRLAEKTDKIPLINDIQTKIIRKYRRMNRKEKNQQKKEKEKDHNHQDQIQISKRQ